MYDNIENFLKNVKEGKDDTLNIRFDNCLPLHCEYKYFYNEITVYGHSQEELVIINTKYCDIEMIENIIRTIKGYYE